MSKLKKVILISVAAAAVVVVLALVLLLPAIRLGMGRSAVKSGDSARAAELLNANSGTWLWKSSKSELTNAELPTVGGTVIFGHYIINESTDEESREELTWSVLAVSDKKALLTTKYVIDCQPYESKADIVRRTEADRNMVTWYTCYLRSFLNTTFLESAFTADEQIGISETSLKTDYSKHSKDGTNAYSYVDTTVDKVFILSAEEAEKYLDDSTVFAPATPFAQSLGVKCESMNTYANYWLRSPGYNQDYAALMTYTGTAENTAEGGNNGTSTLNTATGVRPCIWVSVDSLTD